VTLPTPDAQSARVLSQQSHSNAPIHSMPATPYAVFPLSSPMSYESGTELSGRIAPEQSINVVTHSWDPATGGLKTLTAKRELPTRLERRATDQLPDKAATPRSYVFSLVILACIVVMLISGGVVLFMMLQP
jgi:hypothetical protein